MFEGKKLIEVMLSSASIADIVLLFRGNHALVLTSDEIAYEIGTRPESTRSDVGKLVELGILKTKKIGKQTWYAFNEKRDKEIQREIKNYIESCNEAVGQPLK